MILVDNKLVVNTREIAAAMKRNSQVKMKDVFLLDIYKKGNWSWIHVSYGEDEDARNSMFDGIVEGLESDA